MLAKARRLFEALGPGLITGASDDDPSGIGTYAIAGASLGYSTLWMALVTFPMMAAVQLTCAKVALVSGQGLSGVLRKHYSPKLLYPVVVSLAIANTINAGVDIGAIAVSLNLLVPVSPTATIIPVTIVMLVLLIWGSYRLIETTFKWLTLTLFAYIGASFLANPNWGDVLRNTFIPTFSLSVKFLSTFEAVLGTTISPYLFFWQANQEVDEEVAKGPPYPWQRRGVLSRAWEYAQWDIEIGMFFSNVVMYFIILATGATLFRTGKTGIQTAADAASALRPLAGDAASILFALGIIGAGFLAVPVLVGSAAYALSEAAGWRYGLKQKPERAWQFYTIIAVSMLVGMLVNFVGLNAIQALFWVAVINGLLAPPLLLLIILVANNKKVMGDQTNGGVVNVLGWLTTIVMFAAAVGLIIGWASS